MNVAAAVRYVTVALWVGSLWTVGYLVAPTLFLTLADASLAGAIAGKVFRVEAYFSLASGVILFVLIAVGVSDLTIRRSLRRLVVAMTACTLVGYFALQPFMAALREAAPGGVLVGSARTHFGLLHGAASMLYLVQSISGIFLILKSLQDVAQWRGSASAP